jgi:hypothetical protein
MKPVLCLAVVSVLFGVQLAHAACPNDAVFLVPGNEIRGYPLRANGATEPCQVLQGPLTTLMTAGATVIDRKSVFHVAQFLTNSTVDIFPRNAAVIDTLGTSRSMASPPLLRSLKGSRTALLPAGGLFATNTMTIAVDPGTNELFVFNATTDLTQSQVSVFAAKANGDVPPVRTISGPATALTASGLPGNTIAISSDGRLLVAAPNLRILAFAPGARGNVAHGRFG